jgi:hypothetical protein
MSLDLLVEDWQRVLGAERSRRYRARKSATRATTKRYYLQLSRRKAKSMAEFMAQPRGPKMRDGAALKEAAKLHKDHLQKYSRCKHCLKPFVDGQGREVLSQFEFCGESLLVTGECKKAWLAALPVAKASQPQSTIATPEDHDWDERQGSRKKPMGESKTNWCPECSAYVNQNHEHQVG